MTFDWRRALILHRWKNSDVNCVRWCVLAFQSQKVITWTLLSRAGLSMKRHMNNQYRLTKTDAEKAQWKYWNECIKMLLYMDNICTTEGHLENLHVNQTGTWGTKDDGKTHKLNEEMRHRCGRPHTGRQDTKFQNKTATGQAHCHLSLDTLTIVHFLRLQVEMSVTCYLNTCCLVCLLTL